ncbi:hypothetical protein V1517DRAFT_10058 [Lipomyces orientalis]|uniref:Uncharacterized protein n=1 Tax=Lipomyces orientalis TaxID=1233043 RepID=A0ACC3TJA1_9ASCO
MSKKRLRWKHFEGGESETTAIEGGPARRHNGPWKRARNQDHDKHILESGSCTPTKRRVQLACQNCRQRKSRCDGVKPSCRHCIRQGWECEYRELNLPRADESTLFILDRMESLEDQIVSAIARREKEPNLRLQDAPYRISQTGVRAAKFGISDLMLEMPAKHLGNAMQVMNWPIVNTLLPSSDGRESRLDPIYPFYVVHEKQNLPPVVHIEIFPPIGGDRIRLYLTYFMRQVYCFFPVFDALDVDFLFHLTSDADVGSDTHFLLNVVLAFGALAAKDKVDDERERIAVQTQCWNAAVLLFGQVAMMSSIASIQAAALAGFYCGAQGNIFQCLKYLQIASTMSQIFIKRNNHAEVAGGFSHSFLCTFWCIYCYESDLLSELNFASSGLSWYEDMIPYPSTVVDPMPTHLYTPLPASNTTSEQIVGEDVAICQIVTNSSFRKSINRVNATIYSLDTDNTDCSGHSRASRYVDNCFWTVKYAREFEKHQQAIQDRIPTYILTSPPNLEWNVNRLQRRKFAHDYIIHRNFIEYAVHNPDRFAADPLREEILEYCRRGLEGCKHFIESFATSQINVLTGTFSPGMANVTMVTVLLVSKASHMLTAVLPDGIDSAINSGIGTLIWLAARYPSFQWHANFLQRLKGQVDKQQCCCEL